MKKFTFKKIDAFSTGASGGNPAAGIYLNTSNDITHNEMQQIARDLKGFVSEVVYVFPQKGGFFLKYYSSECEVDFCGHGTIAVMYDLIKNDPALIKQEVIDITVKQEQLKVYNEIAESNSIFISAPSPEFIPFEQNGDSIAAALHIPRGAIAERFPIEMINAGLNTLLVPISGLDEILAIKPDLEELKSFCLKSGIDIILVFSNEVFDTANSFRTRVFAPKFGYLEDPATGSGNSAFGYYLLKHKLWDGSLLTIEQNGSSEGFNTVKLNTVQDGGKPRVIFGGAAVLKIEGEYIL